MTAVIEKSYVIFFLSGMFAMMNYKMYGSHFFKFHHQESAGYFNLLPKQQRYRVWAYWNSLHDNFVTCPYLSGGLK